MVDGTKAADAYRTISEVAEDVGVPQHVLRFWETKFTMIRPLKRGGNRRYYRPEDVALLKVINSLLYTEGYTIRGVQKLLREQGARALIQRFLRKDGEVALADDASAAPAAQVADIGGAPAFMPFTSEAQEPAAPAPVPVVESPLYAADAEPVAFDAPPALEPAPAPVAIDPNADLVSQLKAVRDNLAQALRAA
jgi:DNA-binding transcriptional MerR regulator